MNKYQLVHQIGHILSKNPSPIDGLNKVVRFVSTKLKVWCSIYSYDSQEQQVTMVAATSLRNTLENKCSFGIGTGLIGLAIRKNTIINLDDAAIHPDYHPIPGMEDTPETTPHGILLAPLNTSNRVIGAIVLARKEKHSFSPQTVALLKEIIPALTIFIVNVTLMENKPTFMNYFTPPPTPSPAPVMLPDVLLTGTPVTRGVAYGNVMRISSISELLDTTHIPRPVNTTSQAIEAEKKKLTAAMDKVRILSRNTAEELASTLSEADCNIFEMHAMMVDDPSLQSMLMGFIDQGYDITTSLEETLKIFSKKYMQIKDETLRERLYDIKDVLLNLKNTADNLSCGQDASSKTTPAIESKNIILVAKELLPSQLVSIPFKRLSGIVCEEGGATSHVAILARALQITMMFGVTDIYSKVNPSDRLLLDCDGRKCILRPSLHMLRNYTLPLKMAREQKSLAALSGGKSDIVHTTTADGKPIVFAGNLALICETPAIQYYGVEEIGLYRTEFMYMLKSEMPTESEQLALFKKLIENTNGIPITIRLLDAGGDKPIPYLDCWGHEPNPALGWRGLRFLLSKPSILQPHLRAILRAAAFGKINLLVPMVADIFDLMQIQEAIAQAENDLKSQGLPYSTNYNLGIMLEIPSAIFALKRMLPYINFVSIGTNDLVQFLFAVDRGNQRVRRWYRQCNPMILKIIHVICEQVRQYPGKTVSLCGELAGSKEMLPILLGAGLRKFSMAPAKIPELRAIASKYTIPQCQALYKEVIATCRSEMDVLNLLQQKGMR